MGVTPRGGGGGGGGGGGNGFQATPSTLGPSPAGLLMHGETPMLSGDGDASIRNRQSADSTSSLAPSSSAKRRRPSRSDEHEKLGF